MHKEVWECDPPLWSINEANDVLVRAFWPMYTISPVRYELIQNAIALLTQAQAWAAIAPSTQRWGCSWVKYCSVKREEHTTIQRRKWCWNIRYDGGKEVHIHTYSMIYVQGCQPDRSIHGPMELQCPYMSENSPRKECPACMVRFRGRRVNWTPTKSYRVFEQGRNNTTHVQNHLLPLMAWTLIALNAV